MPTLLKICGAGAQKPAGPFDGLDVSDLLFGAKQYGIPPRDLYHFCGEDGLDHEQIAINSADGWKLIVTGPDIRREGGWQSPGHRVELYRLSEDPSEQRDLAKAEPARVQELAAKLVTFRRSEPQPPLIPTTDRKPADFRPPPHWKIPSP